MTSSRARTSSSSRCQAPFTPTCSSTHLPRYNELAPAFREKGIDTIVCVSVNDPFVMEEWGKDQEAENVLLLPDGNGAFTEAMGLLVDKSDLNFGKRSWRYSMLVRDKVIEKMFLEPQKAGDPFEVSEADTMLHYLDPNAKLPDQVAILTRTGCSVLARGQEDAERSGLRPMPRSRCRTRSAARRSVRSRRRRPCRRSSSTAS
jgi:peroxiredoxin